MHSSSLHLAAARPSFLVTLHITRTNKLSSRSAVARSSYMSNHLDGKSYRCGLVALSAWRDWRLGMRLITRGPNNKISLSFRVINRHSRRILASFVNGERIEGVGTREARRANNGTKIESRKHRQPIPLGSVAQ